MTTTAEIRERLKNALVHELKKADSSFEEDELEKSVEDALSIALSGEFKLLYKSIEEAAKQGCPKTATSKDDSTNGQGENWGFVKLKKLPTPAVPGEYTIIITGTGTVSAGTQYVDNETDFVYVLQSDVICSGTETGTIKSVGEGSEVLKTVGDSLFAQQEEDGIESEVTIASVVTEPVAVETFDDYMEKVIQSFRTTPRGGAVGDYIVWGLEVNGTFKIFPYTSNVPTEGVVYIMQTPTAANPTGAADSDLVDDVQDYIEAKEPMTTGQTTFRSIIERNYDFTIHGLSDNTKQALVSPALVDYFDEKYPFIDGVDDESLRSDLVTKAEIMQAIYDAIFPATIDDITIEVGAVEISNETLPAGNRGNVNSITFSAT